jgi:hypothetical protein
MKKTITTLMIATLFTVSGFAGQVKAAGNTTATTTTASTETTYKDEAGITPDSVLYPLDKLIDEVQVIISFSDGSKVETLLSNAEERLGESEVMAEAGDQDATKEALEAYNETVTEVNDKLDEIVEANQGSEDIDKEAEVTQIEEAVAEQQEISTEVLEGMKDEVSGDSQAVLARVIEMQTAKKAAVRAMVDARHELNASRKEYNAAKVQLNKAEKSGDEEAIKKAQDSLKAAEEALNAEKTEYKTAFEAKQETVKKYAGSKAEATEVKTTDNAVSTETKKASEKVKEEIKSVSIEKKEQAETKKEEAVKADAQGKEKSEKAAEVQNSGKGNNKN